MLLCNRATCRSKLGQFEKAIEDCTAALNVRPSYRKARLRRVHCYAKVGKWEACIEDYEMMVRETPEDEEAIRGLKDSQLQLNKQHSQVQVQQSVTTRDIKVSGGATAAQDVPLISNNDYFRDCISSLGIKK
ncbi:hypothetical protein ACSBR2_029475 [Camellia fascicularis]